MVPKYTFRSIGKYRQGSDATCVIGQEIRALSLGERACLIAGKTAVGLPVRLADLGVESSDAFIIYRCRS